VSDTVKLEIQKNIARITLDRPPLNILDIAMMRALDAALDRALPVCDFVVFNGAGSKAFSAGAEVADHVPERVGEMLSAFHAVFRRLATASCLTVAAVNGHCLGGGMELATFCDFVLSTETAKFGQPEIKLGCFPPIAMITLPQLIGVRAATDLILTGRTISAGEAKDLGLVTRIVPEGQLAAAVEGLLADLSGLSTEVLRLTQRTLRRLHAGTFHRQLEEVEKIYLADLMTTKDSEEGLRAFLEKRAPAWQGR
jgi:cyclohexa-1,5-dienecarbonyl-CoA hydratase